MGDKFCTAYFSSFAYTPQFSQTAVNCCQFAQKTGREGEKVSEVALVRRQQLAYSKSCFQTQGFSKAKERKGMPSSSPSRVVEKGKSFYLNTASCFKKAAEAVKARANLPSPSIEPTGTPREMERL